MLRRIHTFSVFVSVARHNIIIETPEARELANALASGSNGVEEYDDEGELEDDVDIEDGYEEEHPLGFQVPNADSDSAEEGAIQEEDESNDGDDEECEGRESDEEEDEEEQPMMEVIVRRGIKSSRGKESEEKRESKDSTSNNKRSFGAYNTGPPSGLDERKRRKV